MADIKISALPGASTLTGAETIPLVQGGTTKKVTTDQFLIKDGSGNVGIGTASPGSKLDVRGQLEAGNGTIRGGISYSTRVEVGALSNHDLGLIANNITYAVLSTSGNLGLGVTPSAWGVSRRSIDIMGFGASLSSFGGGSTSSNFSHCAYHNGTDWAYKSDSIAATRYEQGAGSHSWYTAPSGTAGNAISWTQAMALDSSGNLLLGTSSNGAGARFNCYGGNGISISDGTFTGFVGKGSWIVSGSSASDFAIRSESSMLFATNGGYERARIDASGNLLVGDTSASGKLHVTNTNNVSGDTAGYFALGSNTNNASSYFLQCVTSGVGGKAYILGNGNLQNLNNSYGAFSDAKLKENITDASPKLAKLMQVRIVNYNLKSDPDKAKLIGVVAQELEKVSPGLIEETADFEDVKKTREVTKSVPVTEQVTVQREQKTVEVVDGKAVVTVTLVDEQTAVPVVDQYPLFDADGQPVLEVDTPEVPEVLDEDGNVTQPAVPATYRQAMHSVPRMQDVTETEEYTERVPLGTVTKSVKYSVFVPMLVKALQEANGLIVDLRNRVSALEAA